MMVRPNDPSKHDIYEFYIKISARGSSGTGSGAFDFFGANGATATTKFKLVIGCVDDPSSVCSSGCSGVTCGLAGSCKADYVGF